MKPNNKIMMCGLALCLIMILIGCASLNTGAGKVSTDGGMVKITKKRIPMDTAVMDFVHIDRDCIAPIPWPRRTYSLMRR